jgi:hypothetical protein
MKSSAKVPVKSRTKEKPLKLVNDPTLDGKDENKVGRVPRKTPPADGIKK